MMKIDLITGILGAGKTTFLREYAQYLIRQGKRIAILENDFGAVNVDMMMLQDLKSEHCQLEMISGGCDPHCHRRRFRTQLIALGMQHFDRVLVEPSGIFDMDEFFDILYDEPLGRWFEIGSILTVIDGETPETLPPHMEYLLASEAAYSGKLVLSKAGEQPNETASRILNHLNRALEYVKCRRRFSEADILVKAWENFTDDDFAGFSSAGWQHADYVKLFRTEEMQSTVRYFMHIRLPENRIADILRGIFDDPACGQLYRLKGSLPAESGWVKVNITAKQTEIAPVPEGQSVLIAIGDTVNRAEIDRRLQAYNTDPEYVSV